MAHPVPAHPFQNRIFPRLMSSRDLYRLSFQGRHPDGVALSGAAPTPMLWDPSDLQDGGFGSDNPLLSYRQRQIWGEIGDVLVLVFMVDSMFPFLSDLSDSESGCQAGRGQVIWNWPLLPWIETQCPDVCLL